MNKAEKQKDELEELLDEDDSDDDDDMDYGTDFIEEGKKGQYKAQLNPGRYLIVARGRDINEFNKIVEIGAGECEIELRAQNFKQKSIIVSTFNAITGEPLKKVMLQLSKSSSKTEQEGLTNKNGHFVYKLNLNHKVSHTIKAEKDGYIPYERDINITKGFCTRSAGNQDQTIRVALQPKESPSEEKLGPRFSFVMTSDGGKVLGSDWLELSLWCPSIADGEEKGDQHLSSAGQDSEETDDMRAMVQEHQRFGFIGHAECTLNSWFRLVAKFKDERSTTTNERNFDSTFSGPL